MVSFVISLLSTLGAFALATALWASARHAQENHDPTEGMGFRDALSGKAVRAMNDHHEQLHQQRNWAIGLFIWAIASGIFAVARGVQLLSG